ncbi:MAG: hypothetical protein DHS20C17_00930 [Cyclobacteriaceae bacterium]|nr:MAG: hypothetical protein DHS20C17_00930 [Cyclobacteriaceae bacterium]
MQKTNHGGGSPYLRGLTGYHTLLLIDGIRFNNTTFRSGPNQYLNTIDPLMTDRIETIRGQGSVQYGSDAIGGVVHILSKKPQFSFTGLDWTGKLYTKFLSSNMESTGRVSLGMSAERTAFSAGYTSKKLGDIKAGGNLGTLEPTGYDENSIDFKLLQKITPKQILTIAYQRHSQKHVPLYHQIVSGEYELYHFDKQERDLAYIKWDFATNSKMFKEVRFIQSLQHTLERRSKRKTNEVITQKDEDKVTTIGTVVEIISNATPTWSISSGVDFYYDKVLSSTSEHSNINPTKNYRGLYPDNSSDMSFAAFSLHTVELRRFNLSFGGRYDATWLEIDDAIFGETIISPTALVGNASLVYKLNSKVNLTGLVNTGFRAPNLNDVSSFGIADFRYEVPNFDLEPEKSISLEVGVKSNADRFSSNFYLFRTDLKDLIANVPATYNNQNTIDGVQVYQRENVGNAVIYGIESDIEYLLTSTIYIRGNINYTFGKNINSGKPMRRIPPLYGSADISYDTNFKVRIFARWSFAGKQDRLSPGDIADNRIAVDGTNGWNNFDLSVHYLRNHFQIQTGINNLFDEGYRMHGSGVDGIGRSFWLSLVLNK